MRTTTSALKMVFLALILCTLSLSCDREERVDRNRERDTLREQMNEMVNSIDRRIAELQQRMETETGDARDAMNKKIEELREDRTDLSQRLERMGSVTRDEWEKFQKESGEAVADAKRKIEDIGE